MKKPIQIIKVTKKEIGSEALQTVNSRELWKQLEVQDKYADWIKYQIESLELEEKLDFEVFRKKPKNPQGGRPETDYILSLDTAKHIAMSSRTQKGKEVRKYFIEMEKYARAQIQKQLQRLKTQDEFNYEIIDCQNLISKSEDDQKVYAEKLIDSFVPIYEQHKELNEFLRYANLFIKGVENQQVKEILTDIHSSIQSSNEKSKELLNNFVKIHTRESDYFLNKMQSFKNKITQENVIS